jgi:DNA polymerase I
MVEGPADAVEDVVARTQGAMADALDIVLSGFRLRSDVKIVRWPDRYMDERGREFWGRLMALLPAGRKLNREADPGYFFLGSRGDPKSLHVSS